MFKKNILKKIKKSLENSILVIDKKAGRTSFDEVYNIRRSFQKTFNSKTKVGHSGTLDPKVTGLLVLAFGKSKKVLEYMLLSEKQYIAEFLFHQEIERDFFEKNLNTFLGKIKQTPPVKSAVKRVERTREIYSLKILNFSEDKRSAVVFCAVEKGTYIRKLVSDLGKKMNIVSSMGDLERVKVSIFSKGNSKYLTSDYFDFVLNKIKKGSLPVSFFYFFKIKKYIYNLNYFLLKEKKIKKIFVNKESLKYLKVGNSVRIKNLKNKKELKKIISFKKNDLIAIFYKKKPVGICKVIKKVDFQKINFETELLKFKKIF